MTALDIARNYISRGWNPVPIPFKEKGPKGKGWQNRVVTEANVVNFFSSTPTNIGVLLGPTSGGLTDVDLDSPEAVTVAGYLMPPTKAIFGRPSKRYSHMLYITNFANSVDKAAVQFPDPEAKEGEKAMILELRCGGGGKAAQTVFPGSTHPSGELISWEHGYDGEPTKIDDEEGFRVCLRQTVAASLFARRWPPIGVRHDTALALGSFLARSGMTIPRVKLFAEAVARAVGVNSDAVKDTIRSASDAAEAYCEGARTYGYPHVKEAFGEKTARKCAELLGYHVDGEIVSAHATRADVDAEVDKSIDEMNKTFAFVMEAGKAVILSEKLNKGRREYVRILPSDFRQMHANNKVLVGSGRSMKVVGVGDLWLEHRNRRQYLGGVVFDPTGKHSDDVLNLWTGFAYKPQAGSWERMKEHVLEIICDGDKAHFEYMMNWMARLVQFPGEQGQVAVVLRSVEGTGKGLLARALFTICGQHGMHIANARYLVGNFNQHLRDCIFLFADEAFYAGDKSHVSILKTLITEPTMVIEAKYVNAATFDNFIHLMMASNEKWVIPASVEARRFFVLEVSTAKLDDRAYFDAILDEMNSGGYAAMLDELLRRDISGFDVRKFPKTAALNEQKEHSFPTELKWWKDVLMRGYVWQSKIGLEADFSKWIEKPTTQLLYASYCDFAKSCNDRHPLSRELFGKFMVQMGGVGKQFRHGIRGEHIVDDVIDTGMAMRNVRRAEVDVDTDRPYGYDLGTLENARAAFEKATGMKTGWPNDAPDELTPEDEAAAREDAQIKADAKLGFGAEEPY